jgi:hypothetical protein
MSQFLRRLLPLRLFGNRAGRTRLGIGKRGINPSAQLVAPGGAKVCLKKVWGCPQ